MLIPKQIVKLYKKKEKCALGDFWHSLIVQLICYSEQNCINKQFIGVSITAIFFLLVCLRLSDYELYSYLPDRNGFVVDPVAFGEHWRGGGNMSSASAVLNPDGNVSIVTTQHLTATIMNLTIGHVA